MTAVVSLGGNLGDRLAHLRRGLEVIAQHVGVLAVSPIYETAAVGILDQPAFLNAIAVLDSDDPESVFLAAQAAEQSQGRLRSRRWGPRTLDVDVITVAALVSDDPRLTLPHPRAHQRGFVLLPWLDVVPAATLPGHGSVRSLLKALPAQDARRVTDALPLP